MSAGPDISRREFIGTAAVVSTVGLSATEARAATASPSQVPLAIHINGVSHDLNLEPRVTLLDLLREHLQLVGTKKGCDHGQCGACTVIINGERVLSCLTLAVASEGANVTTIEGLANGDQLHPVQAAFLHNDGFQCGFCTPGQICSAVAMLGEARKGMPSAASKDLHSNGPVHLTEPEVRERMAGNICRCGAYPNIVSAILSIEPGAIEQGGRA
jgi:xanthine dehydrogenase YagT iron-sulfur-binding subunit